MMDQLSQFYFDWCAQHKAALDMLLPPLLAIIFIIYFEDFKKGKS